MKIVIARPYDDHEGNILNPYIVEYKGSYRCPDFESDWAECLEKAIKKNPVEWDITEVIDLMKTKDWGILSVDYTTVTY